MGLKWNAETGQYEVQNKSGVESEMVQVGQGGVQLDESERPIGMLPTERIRWQQQQTIEQGAEQTRQAAIDGVDPKAEGFGDGWAFGRDVLRGAANAGVALATDYVDLGHGLVDLAVQGASAAVGNGFDGNAIFNDADNALTQARRAAFKTETKAGQITSDILRLGVGILTLPKVGIKGLVTGGKVLTLGKASTTTGVLGALTRLDKALKAGSGSKAVTKAGAITAGLTGVSDDAKRGAKLIRDGDDLMRASFKELGRLGALGDEAKAAWRGTETLASQVAKKKLSFRSFGEALAWDAFVAFNAAGEGDQLFDETVTDMLADAGLPNIPLLQSDPLQSNLTAKFKQMTEGLLIGAPMEAVFSLVQVARYAKAFRKASPTEQKLLINALDAEASVLGQAMGPKLLPPAPGPATPLGRELGPRQYPPGANQVGSFETPPKLAPKSPEDLPGNTLDTLVRLVETGRIQNEVATETQVNLRNYNKRLEGTEPAGLLPEGQQGGELMVRPPTPTVTPQTIRRAWTDYGLSIAGLPDYEDLIKEGVAKLERLLPPNRVDGIDWMDAMEKKVNGAGVIQATDSMASSYYLHRGLLEGWASIDPETGFAQYNRKLAFDFDKSELLQKQAQKRDEAEELLRYNQTLQRGGQTDPAMGPVQDRLASMEARDAYDAAEVRAGQPPEPPTPEPIRGAAPDEAFVQQGLNAADPGIAETLRQADVDQVKAQQFDEQQFQEIDAAALEGIGDDPDSVLVAEMLGQSMDDLPLPVTVEKLGARKYGLVDEAGEVVEQFSTLKQAQKSLEKLKKQVAEEAVAKAKRIRDTQTDQPQIWTAGGAVTDSDVVGKIKFTKTQVKFLQEQGLQLPGTNYDLSQQQMSEFALGLRTLADSGRFVGQQKKMLNNMIDRLEVQVKLLEPQARARRIVNDTVEKATKFIDNGEFCL